MDNTKDQYPILDLLSMDAISTPLSLAPFIAPNPAIQLGWMGEDTIIEEDLEQHGGTSFTTIGDVLDKLFFNIL